MDHRSGCNGLFAVTYLERGFNELLHVLMNVGFNECWNSLNLWGQSENASQPQLRVQTN